MWGGAAPSNAIYGKWDGDPKEQRQTYLDSNGLETVEDWRCHPDCPITDLDEQSIRGGIHLAGNKGPMVNHVIGNTIYAGGWKPEQNNPDYYKDGHSDKGASRFFKQVQGK